MPVSKKVNVEIRNKLAERIKLKISRLKFNLIYYEGSKSSFNLQNKKNVLQGYDEVLKQIYK